MLNGMPEGEGGKGYVPVAGGAKGSIQQRVQTFLGETVTQCSFEWASDHFFFFWPYMDGIFIFFLYTSIYIFRVFWGMKMYDNEYDTKESKIIQG